MNNMIFIPQNEMTPEFWPRAIKEDHEIFIVDVRDVQKFRDTLPAEFQPPTQRNPHGRLPQNVWVGGRAKEVWPSILDVMAKVRFIIADDDDPIEDILGAWRCSNCGHRGVAPKPEHCPHATHLCGNAKLLPQISWLVQGHKNDRHKLAAVKAGVSYFPYEVPSVR